MNRKLSRSMGQRPAVSKTAEHGAASVEFGRIVEQHRERQQRRIAMQRETGLAALGGVVLDQKYVVKAVDADAVVSPNDGGDEPAFELQKMPRKVRSSPTQFP